MADLETALTQARAEAAALAEQLRQARLDLHRCGAADMNRTLLTGAISGVLGFVTGLGLGLHRATRKAKS